MRIIGFGQQMRLDGMMRVQHEITVEAEDGSHHVIPASEDTVQTLIQLHATGALRVMPTVPPPTYRRVDAVADSRVADDVVPPWDGSEPDEGGIGAEFAEEESDPGERMEPVARAVVPSRMPRPKFLEGDEDGTQV